MVIGLQALPSICWLPLAILWFGLNESAIVFVVVMGSLLSVAIATEDGIRVDPAQLLRVVGHARGPRLAVLGRGADCRRRSRASSPASSSGGASPGAR